MCNDDDGGGCFLLLRLCGMIWSGECGEGIANCCGLVLLRFGCGFGPLGV